MKVKVKVKTRETQSVCHARVTRRTQRSSDKNRGVSLLHQGDAFSERQGCSDSVPEGAGTNSTALERLLHMQLE